MPVLTEIQAEVLAKLLGKLKERSSVYGYLVIALGAVGVTDQGLILQIAGYVVLVAGGALFLLNDATVRRLLTGASAPTAEVLEPLPAELPEAIQPAAEPTTSTEEVPMSSTISAYFAVAKVAAQAVLTAEVSAPVGSTGKDRLDIAKASLEAAYPALGFADVAFETIWPLVKPFIDSLVAKFKSAPAAVAAPVAVVEPAAAV